MLQRVAMPPNWAQRYDKFSTWQPMKAHLFHMQNTINAARLVIKNGKKQQAREAEG